MKISFPAQALTVKMIKSSYRNFQIIRAYEFGQRDFFQTEEMKNISTTFLSSNGCALVRQRQQWFKIFYQNFVIDHVPKILKRNRIPQLSFSFPIKKWVFASRKFGPERNLSSNSRESVRHPLPKKKKTETLLKRRVGLIHCGLGWFFSIIKFLPRPKISRKKQPPRYLYPKQLPSRNKSLG